MHSLGLFEKVSRPSYCMKNTRICFQKLVNIWAITYRYFMVFPGNPDNLDESFELAELWAKRMKRKVLGLDRIIAELRTKLLFDKLERGQDTEPDQDKAV